jgi:membrane-associated protease RseP (regulator of RpoE activity)
MSGLMVLGWAFFLLGVMLSIGLHEVGHLVPAKRFGVKCTQYMVGFGPTVWSRRAGETEYGFKAIPLGGYVRMIGMFPPNSVGATAPKTPLQKMMHSARQASADEVGPGDEDRVFYKLPTLQKLTVMLGGPVTNLFLAVVFFTLAMSVLGIPQWTTRIDTVSQCIPTSATSETCDKNAAPSPAKAAGLQPGDVIVGFNGRHPSSWEQLQGWVRTSGAGPVTLTIARNGSTQDVTVDLVTAQRPGTQVGSTTASQVGFLGVGPSLQQKRLGLIAVPQRIWQYTTLTGGALITLPSKMVGVWQSAFDGAPRDPTSPISVVGVGRASGQVVSDKAGWSWKLANLLMILGSLNLALFLFNLIPLLPLDGGHVAGALYESAKRRTARVRHRPDPGPVDVAKALPLAYGVATVLIAASVLLIYADLVSPVQL